MPADRIVAVQPVECVFVFVVAVGDVDVLPPGGSSRADPGNWRRGGKRCPSHYLSTTVSSIVMFVTPLTAPSIFA